MDECWYVQIVATFAKIALHVPSKFVSSHLLTIFSVDIRLNRNALSGSLPTEIGSLTNLGMLSYRVSRSNRFAFETLPFSRALISYSSILDPRIQRSFRHLTIRDWKVEEST